ncbi:hypothetical protein EZV62_003690 [Acer yangbiense]|uniref:Uncharacterized protein n=1 Tax=Acer yangbiense TaxID=1000413 RepID=A0A5C7II50_9ROSI|nr:hypothetical protein EZV62_003690 [Acer yangbiense]
MVSEQHSVTSAPPMQAHNLSQGSATSSKLPTPLKLELTVKLDHNNFLLWRQQVLAAIKGMNPLLYTESFYYRRLKGGEDLIWYYEGFFSSSIIPVELDLTEQASSSRRRDNHSVKQSMVLHADVIKKDHLMQSSYCNQYDDHG